MHLCNQCATCCSAKNRKEITPMKDAPRCNIATPHDTAQRPQRHQGERWARDVAQDKDLTPVARHVLMTLATYRRRDSGVAWPSADTLAQVTGWSVRQVRRALGEIERAGVLEVTRRPGWATHWGFPKAVDPVENMGTPATQSGVTPDTQSVTPDTQSVTPDTQSPEHQGTPYVNPAAEKPDEIADPELARAWLADIRAAMDGDAVALADRLELERYGDRGPSLTL